MPTTYIDKDDPAWEWRDGKPFLRRGATYRVPLSMRDGINKTRITDSNGFSGYGLHRPGFRFIANDSGTDDRAAAYAEYEQMLQRAYRDSAPHIGNYPYSPSAGSYPYSAAAEGSSCTVDGRRGKLVRDPKNQNYLVCHPLDANDDEPNEAATSDAKPPVMTDAHKRKIGDDIAARQRQHQQIMTAVYNGAEREMSNRWRNSQQ